MIKDVLLADQPTKRFVTVEEIAALVVHLCQVTLLLLVLSSTACWPVSSNAPPAWHAYQLVDPSSPCSSAAVSCEAACSCIDKLRA